MSKKEESKVVVNTELLQEILQTIAEKNNDSLINKNVLTCFFKRKPITEFILGLCEKLKIPAEVKFLSIEIFEKFMSRILKEMDEHMSADPHKNWKLHIERLNSQISLRVLSSIQLANKVCSVDLLVKCSEIKKILLENKYNFSLVSIMNSEIRVMKYLDYKLNLDTPFSLMEVLLEILSNNLIQFNPQIIHAIGVKILECYYCQREEIYNRLYETMTGRSRDLLDREAFLMVENNYLFLAAAVIVASAYIYDHVTKKTYQMVLDGITLVTKLDKNDVDDFSVIICYFSLGETTLNTEYL